jgi:hypothetical protein
MRILDCGMKRQAGKQKIEIRGTGKAIPALFVMVGDWR